MARDSPSNALFSKEQRGLGLRRRGFVEGTAVNGIMMSTGCSGTMVGRDLVVKEKLMEGKDAVARYVHGDTVLYPMAQVCMEVDGCMINTTAAVSDTLPMAVLLRKDVPELLILIQCRTPRDNVDTSEASVMTRAETRRRAEEEREQTREGVQPKPVVTGQPQEP